MKLEMACELAIGLKSAAQIARRVTEAWGANNLYCAACDRSRSLDRSRANTEACDFSCGHCGERYEMKAGKWWNEVRVPDAGYDAMMRAIRSARVPNLLILQYSPSWSVLNLMLVPSFFFTRSAIERRPPLGPHARRAGWVGCNILLKAIPREGRIRLVHAGVPANPSDVRHAFKKLRSVSQIPLNVRGWTLDVWNVINRLDWEFDLDEVYRFEPQLKRLHPNNRNIRPKIRQQLQELRDLGVLAFVGNGRYVRRGNERQIAGQY